MPSARRAARKSSAAGGAFFDPDCDFNADFREFEEFVLLAGILDRLRLFLEFGLCSLPGQPYFLANHRAWVGKVCAAASAASTTRRLPS
jgi:hypothetical protein